MAVILSKQLEMLGCEMDAESFSDLTIELHQCLHPSWSVEEMTFHPDDAKRYCQVVRSRCGTNLPDDLILRTISNARKAGKLAADN